MNRSLYFAGWSYVLIAGTLIWLRPTSAFVVTTIGPEPMVATTPPLPLSGSRAWFAAAKPFCNPLEVELRLRASPPPSDRDGAGFAAACWAVAGKSDRARQVIDELPPEDRSHAAGIVFGVGHPIADMGDDLSGGPIMELVVEYQPDNYMALYHAGISLYELGRYAPAKRHLTEFLRLYDADDGWRSNARSVLERLQAEGR